MIFGGDSRNLKTRVGIGLAVGAAALLGLSPAAAPAALHARADALLPAKFGLPAAKEGKAYSFSIATAATGGAKPYRCTPESLHEGSLELHGNCVISGTAPTFAGGTVKRISGPFVFKLTDSETPPKTVTLYPLNLTIISNSEQYPFDGTWTAKTTLTTVITCPGKPPVSRTQSAVGKAEVVHGSYGGHALSISATGISATATFTAAAGGVTITEKLTFTVTGAVTSLRGTITGTGAAGCAGKVNGTVSGSRTSP